VRWPQLVLKATPSKAIVGVSRTIECYYIFYEALRAIRFFMFKRSSFHFFIGGRNSVNSVTS
jgi:hypothetical protein